MDEHSVGGQLDAGFKWDHLSVIRNSFPDLHGANLHPLQNYVGRH